MRRRTVRSTGCPWIDSVEFASAAVGSTQLAFVTETTLSGPFAFARPVRRVRCALQGFDVRYPEDDHHVTLLRIEPSVEFDDAASPTSGLVRVRLAWRDTGSGIGASRIASFAASLVVIGE